VRRAINCVVTPDAAAEPPAHINGTRPATETTPGAEQTLMQRVAPVTLRQRLDVVGARPLTAGPTARQFRGAAPKTQAPCNYELFDMASGDDIAAREASLLENVARLPSTELEQFAAFKALSDDGATAAEIATTFGLPDLRVSRIFALANIQLDILALYANDEIGRESIRHMTMATEIQQAAWLKLWKGNDYAPQNYHLKVWLTGGCPIPLSVAMFDIEACPGNSFR